VNSRDEDRRDRLLAGIRNAITEARSDRNPQPLYIMVSPEALRLLRLSPSFYGQPNATYGTAGALYSAWVVELKEMGGIQVYYRLEYGDARSPFSEPRPRRVLIWEGV
jgi:hypothetical protein